MRRFIVFGRGRSGTTVIADEISHHPGVALPMFEHEHQGDRWSLIEPFSRAAIPTFDGAREVVEGWGLVPYELRLWLDAAEDSREARDRYLDEFEAWGASQPGARAMGFKIIDNQLGERKGLLEALAARGYAVVNIHRMNVVRHALSGLLARQRGVFNERNFRDTKGPYTVEVAEFERAIGDIQHWVSVWDQRIAHLGIESFDVAYEGFLADRTGFYAEIFEFLGLDPQTPESSDFSRMVPPDLSEVIVNFDEIRKSCERNELEHMLTLP